MESGMWQQLLSENNYFEIDGQIYIFAKEGNSYWY